MTPIANTLQIREADRLMIEDRSYPGILLMEAAAHAATGQLLSLFPDENHFWILAGPGNNGGDGLAVARMLHLAGKQVRVWLSHNPDRFTGDAAIQRDILAHLPVQTEPWNYPLALQASQALPHPPVWVDALLGTGLVTPAREPVASLLQEQALLPGNRVAIDLPSGLSADTGAVDGPHFQAQHTLTFQLPKLCHFVYPAAAACGEVTVLDIGIWPEVISSLGIRRQLSTEAGIRSLWREPDRNAHKGTRGHVLLIGGSKQYRGAMALTAQAALRAGAGLVSVAVPAEASPIVLHHAPEAMCLPDLSPAVLGIADVEKVVKALTGKQAVVIGPGLGLGKETLAFLVALLPLIKVPLLLDADALNLLSQVPDWQILRSSDWVITPHPGEMARLSGSAAVNEKRLETAEDFAQKWGVTILLKGAYTLIASPDGDTWINPTGNPGMATGGSGDVLSGVIGALMAQGYAPAEAAVLGAWYHGCAGDLAAGEFGEAGITAGRLLEQLRVGS